MRKRVIKPAVHEVATADQEWLDVEQLAQVEVTSEDAAHPVESALVPGDGAGWRAAQPGEQTLRLVFDKPQRLTRIWLLFIEPAVELRPAGDDPRGGGLSRRPGRGDGARAGDRPRQEWGRGAGVARAVPPGRLAARRHRLSVYRVGGGTGAPGVAGMQIELPGRRAWPGGHCTPGDGSGIPGVELPGIPGVELPGILVVGLPGTVGVVGPGIPGVVVVPPPGAGV
jgi:hypothetical protein